MLRCVVFDMDGTLLDTEKLSVRAWQEGGRKYGYEIPAQFIMDNFGRSAAAIDQRYLDAFGPDFPIREVRRERMERGLRYFEEDPHPVMDGARELLEHLREKGITTALATSTRYDRATLQMEMVGLLKWMDVVVTGDMVEHGKPAPDIFLKALAGAGCPPEEALVVEDSETGARAGLAAGCKTVIVPDLRQPGEEIRQQLYCCPKSLLELIPVVDRLMEE